MENPDSRTIDIINEIVVPRYSPRTPPKDYKENRAVGVFFCLKSDSGIGCPELLRAKISVVEDIYIVPFVEYAIRGYHPRYHESGKFDWLQDGSHIQPAFGEGDSIPAFGEWLRAQHPSCLCFRKGRELNDMEIDRMVRRLAQNLPYIINKEEASRGLKDENLYRIIMPELKKTESFRDLFQKRLRRLISRL